MTEDVRVYHAGAKNLQPSVVFAHGTAFLIADEAGDIHVGTGLRERKERGAKLVFDGASIELADKRHERSLELAEGYVAINGEGFDLVKDDMTSRTHGLIPIHPSGYDHSHRRGLALHDANLHG